MSFPSLTGTFRQGAISGSSTGNLTAEPLVDSSGNTVTSGNISWTATNDYQTGQAAFNPANANNTALLSDTIKTAAAANSNVTVTINSPYTKYDVYVYINGDNASSESISDGTTTYYATQSSVLTSFTQITSTTAGTYTTGNYVKFTGETASTLAIHETWLANNQSGMCGIEIVNAYAAGSFLNNFAVTGNATLDVSNVSAGSIGSLTVNGSTLSVTGNSTAAGTAAYTLTTGDVTLTGNAAFNVSNNGSGAGRAQPRCAGRRGSGLEA